MLSYAQRKSDLVRALQSAGGERVVLAKPTSNLFRDRRQPPRHRLEVGRFNHVLEVDAAAGWVNVEGMTPYDALVDATLPHGVMPAVVPQLRSITIGGAAAGVGIEASSFKSGLVHDTLLEMDVLLADGSVVLCTPDNEHRDLFFGFPNSYGTLGYALRLKARTVPVKAYVQLTHIRHADAAGYPEAVPAGRTVAPVRCGFVLQQAAEGCAGRRLSVRQRLPQQLRPVQMGGR
jgi:FAD/FMN-containing dehydrogenase